MFGLEEWLFYSLLALASFIFFNLLGRVIAVKSENPRAGSFVFNLWASVFATILFFFTSTINLDFVTLKNPKLAILVLVSVLCYAGFERFHFYVRKNIEVSLTTVLFRLAPAITFVLSVAFLREGLSVAKIIGLILIVLGNVLIFFKKSTSASVINKYFWLGVLCSAFLGVAWTVDKVISGQLDSGFYGLFIWILPLPFIYLPKISLQDIKKEFILGSWKSPTMAALNVIGLYFQLKALVGGEASRVLPIINSNSILIVILGIWFLKERNDLAKKVVAAVLAVAGVLLLSLA